jgi:hypothetical protein
MGILSRLVVAGSAAKWLSGTRTCSDFVSTFTGLPRFICLATQYRLLLTPYNLRHPLLTNSKRNFELQLPPVPLQERLSSKLLSNYLTKSIAPHHLSMQHNQRSSTYHNNPSLSKCLVPCSLTLSKLMIYASSPACCNRSTKHPIAPP